MQALLLTLILASNPPEDVLIEHVDILELNHYYDDQGELVFRQLIFWSWHDTGTDYLPSGRFNIRAWRLINNGVKEHVVIDTPNNRIIFHDQTKLRKISFTTFIETWTQYDIELYERKYLPQNMRKGLKNGK